MSPAERRLTELLDKWLTSIDAHFAYLELSDAQYWKVRAWPKHERPNRWVLEVARQKLLELKTFCDNRQTIGDSRFADGMELVIFLANLVGLQSIQRFIPLIDGPVELNPAGAATAPPVAVGSGAGSGSDTTIEMPQTPRARTKQTPPPTPAGRPRAMPQVRSGDDATREMPQIPARRAPKPSPVPLPQFPTRPIGHTDGRKSTRPAEKLPPPIKDVVSPELQNKIVSDAVRLMKWGKAWHELPELIARLADRPQAAVVRRVLRTQKTEIESKLAAR